MADDVAEAEFYLSQGMTEEARAVHRRMQLRDPQDPAVNALAEEIEHASTSARPAETEPVAVLKPEPLEAPLDADVTTSSSEEAAPQEVAAEFTVADPTPELTPAGFVDLGAELAHELDTGDQAASPDTGGPLVDGLIKELQKGVREQLDEKDYETHYNLGIAYKEMELYDEAIQEFRLTAREPKRSLECADLVGLCFLAKGQPEQAVQDLQAGLAIAGHPPEAYHNLRYDLGSAFEAQGDLARALEQFEILQVEGARFLDVQTRLQTLRTQLARTSTPPASEEKPRRKKKISFI
jgi:tetratricopeptide (TPR) repeat protein